MTTRDPDLGRDRTTLALGRRTWGWAETTDRVASPWGTTRRVTAHDRFDRTLGIPPRQVPAWPGAARPLDIAGSSAAERADAICHDLEGFGDGRRWPDAERAAAALADLAPAVHSRPAGIQRRAVAFVARQHRLDFAVLENLARGVGALVAKTTHRAADAGLPGTPSLNALAAAEITRATRLFLARQDAAIAQAESDPDLPRLWLLANGLTHGTPACVMHRVPARSFGPAARIVPAHDDLVGWTGVRAAVDQMRATVVAAASGARWVSRLRSTSTEDVSLAVGVAALTRPGIATQLALHGPARVSIDRLRAVTGLAPHGVVDLSDDALKAMCDRNGWLLGAPDERTARELVERDGALVPDDAELDRRSFRHNPAAAEVKAAHRLVTVAGREALERFGGFTVAPRESLADALRHRFPERGTRDELRVADPALLLTQGPVEVAEPECRALSLDLGL